LTKCRKVVYLYPNGSGRTEKGRNKMSTLAMTATLAINPIQLSLLETALEIEIKTYHTSKMKLTREPALRIFARLIGDPIHLPKFRGLQGRKDALAIVKDFLLQLEDGRATVVK
jgi:hypothetical protein